MTAILALFTGPFGAIARYVALALAIIGAGWFLLARHDAALMAARDAREAAAVSAERDRQHVMAEAALQEAARDAEHRFAAAMSARKAISNAPVTQGCVDSPSIAAALSALQSAPAGHDAAGSPGRAAVLQPAAGSARPAAQ